MERQPVRRTFTLLAVGLSAVTAAQTVLPRLGCDTPKVWVDGALTERWVAELPRACAALTRLSDLDLAAVAHVKAAADAVVVSVTLPDGRTASRRVTDPARLGPTLEALLVVPGHASRTEFTAPVEPEPRRPLKVEGAAPTLIAEADAGALDAGPKAGRWELGASVAGRFGHDVGISPAVYGQLHLGPWRLGAGARWETDPAPEAPQGVPGAPQGRPALQSLGVDLALARHFEVWRLGLDTGVGPLVVIDFLNQPNGLTPMSPDLRAAAFARLGYRLGRFNLFAQLDAELSPGRLAAVGPRAQSSWELGAGFGFGWVGL
jgi:hypothetical protein